MPSVLLLLSTLDQLYQLLSTTDIDWYKHNICPYAWNTLLYYVDNILYTFVDSLPVYQEAMIRDLCIEHDDGYFDILDSEQMCHLIENVCTI